MLRFASITPCDGEAKLKWDKDNEQDLALLKKIERIMFNEQKRCEKCIYFSRGGYFCGYNSVDCELHGNLDYFKHPHHDLDGSKCLDYDDDVSHKKKSVNKQKDFPKKKVNEAIENKLNNLLKEDN